MEYNWSQCPPGLSIGPLSVLSIYTNIPVNVALDFVDSKLTPQYIYQQPKMLHKTIKSQKSCLIALFPNDTAAITHGKDYKTAVTDLQVTVNQIANWAHD